MTTKMLSLALVAALAALASPARGQDTAALPDAPLTTLDGEKISLRGGPRATELVFVASWCLPCEREMTGVRRRLGALRRDGYRVVLVGVAGRQTQEQFASWAENFGFNGPLVYDRDGALQRGFKAKLLPWHVVVGRNGEILHQKDEPPSLESLRTWAAP